MKLFHCFLFLCIIHISLAQSPDFFEKSFTEKTTDQEKFAMYLDSINKYLYRDLRIAEIAIANCQSLIDQGISLPDSSLFGFVIESIYYKHSMADPIDAYQIILKWENAKDSLILSQNRRGTFNYMKGFTYMALGDLEAAQQTYYDNLAFAKVNQDTNRMVQCLFSLAQLYNDEKDYEEAIGHFQQILDLQDHIYIRPSTLTLVYLELGESYSMVPQIDHAFEALQIGFDVAQKNKLKVLMCDLLALKGEIHLMKNQVDSSLNVYDRLSQLIAESQDQNVVDNTQKLLAHIYVAQEKYAQALRIYKKMRDQTPDTNVDRLMMIYNNAHQVCKEMGDYESAYDYLMLFNDVRNQRDEDVKKQKTQYLKIKFDSEQKETENALLTAAVLQSQTESIILYSGLALAFLVLVILFGAFYQKQRYSKNLEREVLDRTMNLSASNNLLHQSNEELKEFNRILSHDLKEPLRSIVGFSQLASSKVPENTDIQEYLGFVTQSGLQLQQLITSINAFQAVSVSDTQDLSMINIPSLLVDILLKRQDLYPNKDIKLHHNAAVSIFGHLDTLTSVFDILIDNAIKFNEQAGVTISVRYFSEDQHHCLEIEDNGIGIAPAYHTQVFNMFKRLRSRKDFVGSGLGLSIAKKMLTQIGGDISVLRSKENEGTTFLLRFPKSEEEKRQLS